MITILYFAWLRERTGLSEETFALSAGQTTVADLIEILAERHPAAFQNRRTIRCAVNQEFADLSIVLRAGDEVAFFPPVTGG
jgi:molybdopterin converting factor subunit 1